jgi:hypothetical protein
MQKLTQVCGQIHQLITSKALNINYELAKKEYNKIRQEASREVEIAARMAKTQKTME